MMAAIAAGAIVLLLQLGEIAYVRIRTHTRKSHHGGKVTMRNHTERREPAAELAARASSAEV